MDNDKPSIAELQRIFERPHVLDRYEMTMLRDAAPMLIELAAAALALREQEQFAARTRATLYSSLRIWNKAPDSEYAATDCEDTKLAKYRLRYLAALARVRN